MTPPGLVFDGDVPGRLAPLRLTVPGGRWTCLLGASGIGKSTLLHSFAGTVVPNGICTATDGGALAGRVALMAQSDLLLPWLSAADNVAFGARLRGDRADRARVAALLDAVGLADHAGRKPGTLSGGQRQRVALARTLYEDRPVVLMDEPFSALDVATRVRMQDLAVRLLSGRTVLHVTHDPAEAARLGEAIVVLLPTGPMPHTPPPGPIPRAPDSTETLAATGALTRAMLEAA
ncbi:ABC transporter ATP-binding protein [Paenirhodobacter sp.]|uniref:ABC transporter ATP-binding protein n=1 Tax=Paenirhodobacter sp. TaxID=1965326 RepID=UPI003B3D6EDC